MIKCFTVPEIWCVTDGRMVGQTDRKTDGWTDGKSDIVVGAQPKKKFANENTVLNFIVHFTKVTELIFSLKH